MVGVKPLEKHQGCCFFLHFLRDLILEMGKLKVSSRSFIIFSWVWWCFSGSFPVVVVSFGVQAAEKQVSKAAPARWADSKGPTFFFLEVNCLGGVDFMGSR